MTKTLLLQTTCVVSLWLVLSGHGATAQTLADDPAFVASRQTTEALNVQDYANAEGQAREAIEQAARHAETQEQAKREIDNIKQGKTPPAAQGRTEPAKR